MAEEPGEGRKPRVRSGPTLGTQSNISVPISFGLPLTAVGVFLLIAANRTGKLFFWVSGGLVGGLGLILIASGKSL